MGLAAAHPRILIVTSSWPRTGDEIAGTFVRADARARARSGARVWVATPCGNGAARGGTGITTVDVEHGGAFGSPGAATRLRDRPWRAVGLLGWGRGVGALARTVAPHRLVAHWLVPSGLLAVGLAGALGHPPTECFAHGGDVRLLERAPRPIARRFIEWLGDGSTIFAVSAPVATRLADIAPSVARSIGVRAMPLDGEDLRRARAAAPVFRATFSSGGSSSGSASTTGRWRPLAVVAARLVDDKRIERAIDHVSDTGGGLVLLGDGPARARLVAWARRRRVPILSPGALPHLAALTWIAAADVVLAPLARDEGAPTVVHEAEALGVPCVVFP